MNGRERMRVLMNVNIEANIQVEQVTLNVQTFDPFAQSMHESFVDFQLPSLFCPGKR